MVDGPVDAGLGGGVIRAGRLDPGGLGEDGRPAPEVGVRIAVLFEVDDEGVVVRGIHAGDLVGLLEPAVIDILLEVPFHDAGGHLRAIGEHDAVPQVEGKGLGVRVHVIGRAEERDILDRAVGLRFRLEKVFRDGERVGGIGRAHLTAVAHHGRAGGRDGRECPAGDRRFRGCGGRWRCRPGRRGRRGGRRGRGRGRGGTATTYQDHERDGQDGDDNGRCFSHNGSVTSSNFELAI